MKSKLLALALIVMLVFTACTPKTEIGSGKDTAGTAIDNAFPIVVNESEKAYPAKDDETLPEESYPIEEPQELSQPEEQESPEADSKIVTVLVPNSTTSLPILQAAKHFPGMKVEVFENHPQANAQFMGSNDFVLVTGLSVGLGMFNNEAPVKLINTNVTGLAYLVSCNHEINRFADLAGHEIYMPFEGSPMEETTKFFVEKAGLTYGEDVKPIYAPFDTSTALIKNGQDAIVAMPQPAATAMAAQECGHLGASFYDTWNEVTGDKDGYPQVGAFAKASFVEANPDWIIAFNEAVAKAIGELQASPDPLIADLAENFSFPAPVLVKAFLATKFTVQSDKEMKDAVIHYYETIGKPLDEKYEDFFYTLP